MIIYLAASPIGKLYIGQTTKSLTRRRQDHEYSARHGSLYPFHCAIRKYGANSFVWNIIARADSIAALNAQEAACIAEYNTIAPNGYNMRTGGDSSIPTAETREKMSEARKAFWAAKSQEERAAIFAKAGAKISAKAKGRKHTPERCANVVAGLKAHWAAKSDGEMAAWKAKISAAQKARWAKKTPEYMAAFSEMRSAAAKAQWAKRKGAK